MLHLSGESRAVRDEQLSNFQRAYEANNRPENMAMYSHNDSDGRFLGLSITPESTSYCPFASGWSEVIIGNSSWVAGDPRLKTM